ncbi:MAG: hypothetical protein NVS3B20_10880 [Polyangiales bacterium]
MFFTLSFALDEAHQHLVELEKKGAVAVEGMRAHLSPQSVRLANHRQGNPSVIARRPIDDSPAIAFHYTIAPDASVI